MGRHKGSKDGFRTMIPKICKICEKHFEVEPRKEIAKYCSVKCFGISKRVQIAWNKGKKMSKEYCEKLSISQKGKYRGSKRYNWKGGKFKNGDGYMLILKRNHPFCSNKGYVKRARLVMEKYLRRYLTKEEISHHVNKIKNDDRIENLMLFANQSKHITFHNRLRGHKINI